MKCNIFKIAVLIPIYNWNISKLLQELCSQIASNGFENDISLCLLDDFSSEEFSFDYTDIICHFAKMGVSICYKSNEVNLGRSVTRNKLLEFSSSDYCLLLDSDVIPDASDFLLEYYNYALSSKFDIVCGGVSYKQAVDPDLEFGFYLYQGRNISEKPSAIRNVSPWKWIFTANVMVKRNVFEAIPFSDRFSGYGYEDIEWGIRLAQSVSIIHIDNTVTHLGLLNDALYQNKMKDSIKNYFILLELHPVEATRFRFFKIAYILSYLPNRVVNSFITAFSFAYKNVNLNFIKNISFQMEKSLRVSLGINKKRKVSQL